jgi:ribosomal protein S18 acetylase RimI-like enzyme
MKAAVTIRSFEERDLDGVIAVARDLQRAEFRLFSRMKSPEDIGPDYVHHIHKDVEKHQGSFLVADLAGKIVGYCTLLTHCDSSDEPDEALYHYAHVGDLAVAESQRNNGIGAMLVNEAGRIAKAAGISWLRLSVLAPNAAARRFYARQGFSEHLIKVEKAL